MNKSVSLGIKQSLGSGTIDAYHSLYGSELVFFNGSGGFLGSKHVFALGLTNVMLNASQSFANHGANNIAIVLSRSVAVLCGEVTVQRNGLAGS